LIGSAGNLVRTEDFLAIVDGDLDEEGDLVKKQGVTPATPEPAVKEAVQKDEGLIVFFPGIHCYILFHVFWLLVLVHFCGSVLY